MPVFILLKYMVFSCHFDGVDMPGVNKSRQYIDGVQGKAVTGGIVWLSTKVDRHLFFHTLQPGLVDLLYPPLLEAIFVSGKAERARYSHSA